MKNITLVALAAIAALVLGFGALSGTQTASADTDAALAVGCEFLATGVDGDATDVTTGADLLEACDGLDAADVAGLAAALGDEDDELTVDDLEDQDLDANQIEEGGVVGRGSIYVFAFVDDDGMVTFDTETGTSVTINLDGVSVEVTPAADADAETCTGLDDQDCGTTDTENGDGVVVATITTTSADAGDEIDVDVEQESVSATETLIVTGAPDSVSIAAVETTIQTSGSSSDVSDCLDDAEVTDSDLLGEPNITYVISTVIDADDVVLARVSVTTTSDDSDIADIDVDTGENGDDPNGDTSYTVDGGDAGIGSFAIVCGGDTTGTAVILSEILGGDEDSDVEITVVGEPDSVALAASPAAIACDGTASSTVSATVTDSDGNNVANGVDVNFSVVALGTANPINASTTDGVATSVVTPLSSSTAGVTVIVTSGDAQASIRVDCSLPVPTTVPVGTPTRGTGIIGPDTGNGGYIGQSGSAGFPALALVALALGSLALVGGGLVTRRVSK